MTQKITLAFSPAKPRNPLVAAARFRRAGVHRRPAGGARQLARQALQRELHRSSADTP